MNSVYDKKWSPYQIVITIACILMIIVTLLPVLNIVAISLSGKNAIAKGLVGVWPKEFTLEAYKMVFQNNNIVHSLFYSVFLTHWLRITVHLYDDIGGVSSFQI